MATYYENYYTSGTYTFEVRIDKNGGDTAPSGGSASKSSNAASVTVYKQLPETEPTWAGHNFLGYSLHNASNPVSVQAGETVSRTFTRNATLSRETSYYDTEGNLHVVREYTTSNQSGTTYVYAQWELKTYTVSYNANGGTGAPASQTKTHGTDLTLSSTIPTRTNYVFDGWATSSTGAVVYQAGDTYSTEADVTLYAIWHVAAATLTSVNNCNINTGETKKAYWTIANQAHTYKLKFSLSGAPDYIVPSSGYIAAGTTEQQFVLPTSWYDALPNSTSATATCTLYSYDGSTLVGSTSKTFKVSVGPSIKPSISAFTAVAHSQNQIAEGWGVAVQGYSYLTLSVTATPGDGENTTITQIAFTGQGINQTSDATSGNTAVFGESGTFTYTVTVTDSRGRTRSSTISVTVYEYATPTVSSLQAVRCLNDGTQSDVEGNYIKALPVFVYSPVNGNNTLSVKKIEYKQHTATTWTVGIQSAITGTWSAVFGPADIAKTYDVRCVVTDDLGNTYTLEVIVPPVVGFSLGLENDRARFGGPVEKAGLQVDWDADFKGGISGQGFADLLFGIGNTIANGTNCNTIKAEGKYTCPSSTVGGSLSNAPYSSAFGMFVVRVAESQRLVQIAMPNSSTVTIKFRYYSGGSWSAWKTLTPS